MFKYILKRVTFFIPTLIIISLVTFALSTLAPGDPVELKLQGGMQGQAGQLESELTNEKAYLDASKKLGFHLPQFYVTLTTQAFPDTLYKIARKYERKNLTAIINQYGNWPQISDYYHSIKTLKYSSFSVTRDSTSYNKLTTIRNNCDDLMRTSDDGKIVTLIDQISEAVRKTVTVNIDSVTQEEVNSTESLIEFADALKNNYTAVVEEQTRGKLVMPAMYWNGLRNQYHRWLFGDIPWFPNREFEEEFQVTTTSEKQMKNEGYYFLKIYETKDGVKGKMVTRDHALNKNENPITFKTFGLEKDKDYIVEASYSPDYDPTRTSFGMLRGDFGRSYLDNRPVKSILFEGLNWTIQLNLIALLIIYSISIPLGVFSAVNKDSTADRITTTSLFILYSLPSFWIGTLLIVFVTTDQYGEWLDLFPTYGVQSKDITDETPFFKMLLDRAHHFALPVFCLTYGGLAFLSRQMRGGVLDVIKQDYIRTARAKGLDENTVVWKHAFRNSLIPIITIFAFLLPSMIGGSVIIEFIFNIPGMGRISFDSISARNWPVLFTILMFSAILTLIGVLLSDILYAVVDPRISFTKKS